jgi:hypothetical protein
MSYIGKTPCDMMKCFHLSLITWFQHFAVVDHGFVLLSNFKLITLKRLTTYHTQQVQSAAPISIPFLRLRFPNMPSPKFCGLFTHTYPTQFDPNIVDELF